jgi:hypothetical protein
MLGTIGEVVVERLPVDTVRLLILWTLVPGRLGHSTLVTGLLVQGRIRQALRSRAPCKVDEMLSLTDP